MPYIVGSYENELHLLCGCTGYEAQGGTQVEDGHCRCPWFESRSTAKLQTTAEMGKTGMVFAFSPGGGVVRRTDMILELVSCVSDSKPKKTTPSSSPAHTAWQPFPSHT